MWGATQTGKGVHIWALIVRGRPDASGGSRIPSPSGPV
jgi:hypothetical protein